jgi:hypothetical protein
VLLPNRRVEPECARTSEAVVTVVTSVNRVLIKRVEVRLRANRYNGREGDVQRVVGTAGGGRKASCRLSNRIWPVAARVVNDAVDDRKRANGSSFKNQGDCIQYVNTGK